MIKIARYHTLPEDVLSKLREYTDEAFGHVPFVQQHTWAAPDQAVLLFEKEELVAFYNVVERTVLCDGRCVKVMGINNVITPVAHRGKGYASLLLQQTQQKLLKRRGLRMAYSCVLMIWCHSMNVWVGIQQTVLCSMSSQKG